MMPSMPATSLKGYDLVVPYLYEAGDSAGTDSLAAMLDSSISTSSVNGVHNKQMRLNVRLKSQNKCMGQA